jgi:hypothetical protein
MLSPQHLALNREAGIAAELIASGLTLLGRASYARTGLYGQAFFNLSIGFERTTKLIYIADYAIDNAGKFPSNDMLKSTIGHDLDHLFSHVEKISIKRRSGKDFSERPRTDIHNGIVQTLTEFARTTRYYNLDLVTGGKAARNSREPMAAWNERVIQPILEKHCKPTRRNRIDKDAAIVSAMFADNAVVTFVDEAGGLMKSVYAASQRTGETEIATKWAPFYVLQLARWLTFLIDDLAQKGAYIHRIGALLGLEEHFGIFMNEDAYLKSRRTWSTYRL